MGAVEKALRTMESGMAAPSLVRLSFFTAYGIAEPDETRARIESFDFSAAAGMSVASGCCAAAPGAAKIKAEPTSVPPSKAAHSTLQPCAPSGLHRTPTFVRARPGGRGRGGVGAAAPGLVAGREEVGDGEGREGRGVAAVRRVVVRLRPRGDGGVGADVVEERALAVQRGRGREGGDAAAREREGRRGDDQPSGDEVDGAVRGGEGRDRDRGVELRAVGPGSLGPGAAPEIGPGGGRGRRRRGEGKGHQDEGHGRGSEDASARLHLVTPVSGNALKGRRFHDLS